MRCVVHLDCRMIILLLNKRCHSNTVIENAHSAVFLAKVGVVFWHCEGVACVGQSKRGT